MSLWNSRPSTGIPSVKQRRQHRYLVHVATILAAIGSMAANHASQPAIIALSGNSCRSQHFIVTAPEAAYAHQVCVAAERFRRDLAVEWLGHELPQWQDPCPIRVHVGPHLGAGGATTFTFIDGLPRQWEMEIQGSRERILDSVLPHEITHTIMATHFGCPLPRWADEGAATSVEHAAERTKQDKLLIEFLTTERGIAFNQMFAMREYPRDILPLYSQGYSLARFLIARGGKQKFVAYLGDGMKWNNWTAATQEHYQMRSLSELQLTWLDWVRHGSPAIPVNNSVAATTPQLLASAPARPAGSGLVPLPPRRASGSSEAGGRAVLLSNPQDGWYRRQRDEAIRRSASPSEATDPARPRQRVGRPADGGRILLR